MRNILLIVVMAFACGCQGAFMCVATKKNFHCLSVPKKSAYEMAATGYRKSVDQKLAERGITDADINRVLDKRDDKGNKIR